jgi:hypothetical protein
MNDHDTIILNEEALNYALGVGNAASAAGLDDQAQAAEIIKAYIAYHCLVLGVSAIGGFITRKDGA